MPVEPNENLEEMFGSAPAAPEKPEAQPTQPSQQEPSTTQTQASTPAPSQPAVPSLPPSLLSRAQAAGLPLDGIDSSDKLAEAIMDRYLQDRAYADYGRQSLATSTSNQANPQANEKYGSGEGNSSQAVADEFDLEGHFGGLWKASELSEQAKFLIDRGAVVLGEDGMFVAKPGFEAWALPHLSAINEAHQTRESQLRSFFEGNPYKAIYEAIRPAFEHEFGRKAQEESQRALTEYQQVNFVEKFQNDNKAWLFDAAGNLTAQGNAFRSAVAELREQGISDPQKLAAWAMKIAGIVPQASQPSTPPAPTPSQDRQRDEQGRYLPAGTPAPAAPPPVSKQESFIDQARRQAALHESRGGGIAHNPDYQIVNEGELENMFSTAWRQAAVA